MPPSPIGAVAWAYAPELQSFASGIAVLLQQRGQLNQLNFVLLALTAHLAANGGRPPGSLAQTIRKFVNRSFPLDPNPPVNASLESQTVDRIYAHLKSLPRPVVAAVCMHYLDGSSFDEIAERTGVSKTELQGALEGIRAVNSQAGTAGELGSNAETTAGSIPPNAVNPCQRILTTARHYLSGVRTLLAGVGNDVGAHTIANPSYGVVERPQTPSFARDNRLLRHR